MKLVDVGEKRPLFKTLKYNLYLAKIVVQNTTVEQLVVSANVLVLIGLSVRS